MLDSLVRLYQHTGTLSQALINDADEVPHPETYRKRFGTLANAFLRIGFVPLSPADLASPVGRAPAEARHARLSRWVIGEAALVQATG